MSEARAPLRSEPALRGVTPAAAAVLAFLASLSTKVLNDGDTWWHVAAGRLMIASRAVLRTDPFSATLPGAPWFTHEWLSEVLLAGAFNLGGWSGVVVLTAAAASLTAWILARELGRWVSGLPGLVLLAFGLLLWTGSLLARPHMLALPILALWSAELVRARAEDRSPRWRVLPFMTLWANLHGSFVFGLALIGPFALEALIAAARDRRLAVVLRWGGFGLAAAGAAALTPHGVETLIFPFRLIGMSSLAQIGEWAPSDFAALGPLEIALLAGLFVVFTRPFRMPPVRAVLLILLLHLALQHVRYDQMLGVVGALILAEPLSRAYGQTLPAPAGHAPRRTLPAGVAAAGLVLALGVGRLAWPLTLHDAPTRPISAVAAVPAQVAATPVFNDYSFGGYLIARHIAPYVDSRADFYGDAFLKAYANLIAPDRPALARLLDQRHIGWTLLIPGSPAARAMDEMPGWRRFRADRWAVIHVRLAAPQAALRVPARNSSAISPRNGSTDSRSAFAPPKNGFTPSISLVMSRSKLPSAPAENAMPMPAIAPPAI